MKENEVPPKTTNQPRRRHDADDADDRPHRALALGLLANGPSRSFGIGVGNVLEAAHQLQKEFGVSIDLTTTEIGQLAQAFNHMAGSLEAASAKQQAAIEEMNACIDIMNTTSIVSKSDPRATSPRPTMDISKYSQEN